MAAANIVIERSCTARISGVVKNASGTPIDLTGCTVTFSMRQKKDDGKDVLRISNADASDAGSVTLVDAVAGSFEIVLASEFTGQLAGTEHVYQIDVAYSDGHVERIGAGNAAVNGW